MKRFLKVCAFISGMCALLCMTGYDCPECNYIEQTIALAACAIVCLVCSYASLKIGGEL